MHLQAAAFFLAYVAIIDGQNCIEKSVSSQNVRERFSDAAVSKLCRREEEWNERSLDSLGRSLNDLLTPVQVNWFNSVQACDFFCVCRRVVLCAKFLESFGTLITGNIGGGIEQIKSEFERIGNENEPETVPSTRGISGIIDMFKRGRRKRELRRAKRQLSALQKQLPPVHRKEYRMLSDLERTNFHTQLNRLKNERVDGMSKFDILVVYHRAENSPGAHFGPAFLPFHRELLRHLETALRLQDPTVAMPYWDSTLDEPLPDPTHSILWTPQFLGNGFGEVTTGPFSSWRTLDNQKSRDVSPNLRLFRDLGKNQFGSLLKPSDMEKINSAQEYRDLTFCIDPFFELVHGSVHMWVGGYMDPLELSPNDPIFFLLHTHVDQIWDAWRRRKQTASMRANDYPPNAEACNNFHYADAVMKPFKLTNKEGLKDQHELFVYDPPPSCSSQRPDCGSNYLFCDTRAYRCMSKVVMGGNCVGFDGLEICLGGQCVRGRCTQGPPPARVSPPTTTTTTTTTTTSATTTWITRTFKFTPPAVVSSTTTRPNVPATVWFPITVQKYRGRFATPAAEATVRSIDLSSGLEYTGTVSSESEYPFYPGSAFAQAPNPGQKGRVEVRLEVTMPGGAKCTSLCLSKGTIYIVCDPRVVLDSNAAASDPIPFTTIQEQAPFLNWDAGPLRNPDPYLFLCASSPNAVTQVQNKLKETLAKRTKRPNISKEETCFNKHRCCSVWSAAGECRRNPSWMFAGCARACEQCHTIREYAGCTNIFNDCDAWRRAGECENNPLWMEENCPQSCGTCARTSSELNGLCGAPERNGSTCQDLDLTCPAWARSGSCRKNEWWMTNNCPRSCKKC